MINRTTLCSLMDNFLCALKFSAKALHLLYAVKYKDTDEAKKLLGKQVIELHQHCDMVKWKYAKYVHQSGKAFGRLPSTNSQLTNQKLLWLR